MKKNRIVSSLLLLCMTVASLAGMPGGMQIAGAASNPDTRYITMTGAGQRDGTSWENAWGANATLFQAAWDQTPEGGTLYVGSGTYNNVTITASSGGRSAQMPKRLIGIDRGAGKPVVKGTFVPPTKATSPNFFTVNSGVSYIQIENIRIENYYFGIYTKGNNSYVNIDSVDVYVTNDAIRLNGGGTSSNSNKLSDSVISNCNFYYYVKSGVRTENRVEDVLVYNCYADGGGEDYWYEDNWPVGFRLTCTNSNAAERRITFVDCVSKGNYHRPDPVTDYWNADGFCSEGGSYDISFIRCKSYGATDGGWDIKTNNATLIDCIAMDNKRNYRFWKTAAMTNCLSAYAYERGGGIGSGGPSGLWVSKNGGTVTADFCTFFNNNGAQIESESGGGANVTLNDCIVGANITGYSLYWGSGVITNNRTAEYLKDVTGEDPQINVMDNTYFYGESAKYNSGLYGSKKGYHWTSSVNKDNLYVNLKEAKELYYIANANVGTNSGQYEAASVSALSAAVASAELIYYDYNASQSQVDAAVIHLQNAIEGCTPLVLIPTLAPEPTIPAGRILVNNNGTISNPYGKIGISLVRVDVTGIFDPVADNKTVTINGVEARYTKYNNSYQFVALSYGTITTDTVLVITKTPLKLVYGDLNMSETIESTDMNLLKGTLAGNRKITNNFEFLAADVNGDGELSSTDMNLLKGFLAGNLTVLPMENR